MGTMTAEQFEERVYESWDAEYAQTVEFTDPSDNLDIDGIIDQQGQAEIDEFIAEIDEWNRIDDYRIKFRD